MCQCVNTIDYVIKTVFNLNREVHLLFFLYLLCEGVLKFFKNGEVPQWAELLQHVVTHSCRVQCTWCGVGRSQCWSAIQFFLKSSQLFSLIFTIVAALSVFSHQLNAAETVEIMKISRKDNDLEKVCFLSEQFFC